MIDEKVFEDLKAQHGPCVAVELPDGGGDIVMRRPTGPELDRYIDTVADSKNKSTTIRAFVKACTVYPDKAGLEAIFAAQAGAHLTCVAHLNAHAGIVQDAAAKK